MITAATITDEMIRELRAHAVGVGDLAVIAFCDVALWAYPKRRIRARRNQQEARARLAEILNARAKGES